MVYFRYLFQHMEDLTPVEGLVYSELVLYSLASNENCCVDGMVSIERSLEEVKDIRMREFKYDFETAYCSMKPAVLMEHTELTFPTVQKTLASLKEKGYIREGWILCPLQLIEKGYIKIPYKTHLKGRQLIFYAFLLDRSYPCKGTLDTWAYKFKELCGVNEGNVYFLINKLKEHGLVERLKDGKLQIYTPDDIKKGKPTLDLPPL